MKASPFFMSNPRHMFEKAKRDFDKMKANVNTETVFNFFVTAYHIRDYVENQSKALRDAIFKEFNEDKDFRMCRYICEKGKHMELTHERWKDYQFNTQHNLGGLLDGAPLDAVYLDANESYRLVADGKEIEVIALGQQILQKWERFFKANGI
jgi:hypothetical protein